ncbi:MAG: hypothetical protein GW945_03140, partial [Candidatus Pacebacteria bacterium]|nr:hypothetical protein [Candidatus Paceibacterota bacterium]
MEKSKLSSQLKQFSLLEKRIPTFIGLGVLVIGLVVGTIFLGKGSGVFAPRAAPETTPTNVRLTNITDTSFTVSFTTSSPAIGSVKYGEVENKLKLQASDDRNQLSGSTSPFTTHHISV